MNPDEKPVTEAKMAITDDEIREAALQENRKRRNPLDSEKIEKVVQAVKIGLDAQPLPLDPQDQQPPQPGDDDGEGGGGQGGGGEDEDDKDDKDDKDEKGEGGGGGGDPKDDDDTGEDGEGGGEGKDKKPLDPKQLEERIKKLEKKIKEQLEKDPLEDDDMKRANDPFQAGAEGKGDGPLLDLDDKETPQDAANGDISDKINSPGAGKSLEDALKEIGEDGALEDLLRQQDNMDDGGDGGKPGKGSGVVLDGALLKNKAVSLDNRKVKVKMGGGWKALLARLIDDAYGVKEEHDPEAMSRKIVGLQGREIEKPAMENVVVIMDGSGSMTYDKYKPAFTALDNIFTKTDYLQEAKVFQIVFGTSATWKKHPEYKASKIQGFFNKAKGGTTSWTAAARALKMKMREPIDLVIVASDYEFHGEGELRETKKIFMKKGALPVTIYLAPKKDLSKSYLNDMKKYFDPQFFQKLVKF